MFTACGLVVLFRRGETAERFVTDAQGHPRRSAATLVCMAATAASAAARVPPPGATRATQVSGTSSASATACRKVSSASSVWPHAANSWPNHR